MVVRFPREHNAKLKQLHAETEPKGRPAGKAATGELWSSAVDHDVPATP